jgi:hypothetical protein
MMEIYARLIHAQSPDVLIPQHPTPLIVEIPLLKTAIRETVNIIASVFLLH